MKRNKILTNICAIIMAVISLTAVGCNKKTNDYSLPTKYNANYQEIEKTDLLSYESALGSGASFSWKEGLSYTEKRTLNDTSLDNLNASVKTSEKAEITAKSSFVDDGLNYQYLNKTKKTVNKEKTESSYSEYYDGIYHYTPPTDPAITTYTKKPTVELAFNLSNKLEKGIFLSISDVNFYVNSLVKGGATNYVSEKYFWDKTKIGTTKVKMVFDCEIFFSTNGYKKIEIESYAIYEIINHQVKISSLWLLEKGFYTSNQSQSEYTTVKFISFGNDIVTIPQEVKGV